MSLCGAYLSSVSFCWCLQYMVFYVSFSAVRSSFFALFEDVSLLSWVDDYIVFYVFLPVYLSLSDVNLLFLTVFVWCVFSGCVHVYILSVFVVAVCALCCYNVSIGRMFESFSVFVCIILSDESSAMCITLFFQVIIFFSHLFVLTKTSYLSNQ